MTTSQETTSKRFQVSLSRNLGLFDVTMIGVGAIGAGIFGLTGIVAGEAGPVGLLLAFFLNGLVTSLTGLTYAELGAAFPQAGGGYAWVKEGLARVFGFYAGWVSWFSHSVACSLYAVLFGTFFIALVELAGLEFGDEALVLGLTGEAMAIKLLAALVALTFVAFEGYEIIAQSGEEVKDPGRNIPAAIFLAIGIVVVIYLAVALVSVGALQQDSGRPNWVYLGANGERAMIETARAIMPYGALIMILGGLASTMSALNATVYSSSRVSFAMGRDRDLPAVFGRIHPRNKTPHRAAGPRSSPSTSSWMGPAAMWWTSAARR